MYTNNLIHIYFLKFKHQKWRTHLKFLRSSIKCDAKHMMLHWQYLKFEKKKKWILRFWMTKLRTLVLRIFFLRDVCSPHFFLHEINLIAWRMKQVNPYLVRKKTRRTKDLDSIKLLGNWVLKNSKIRLKCF